VDFFGTNQTYMPVETVDETADVTEMQGPSSTLNQMSGKSSIFASPTKSLIALWVLAIVMYWFIGWFFRGNRA